ncbi:KAP family P-loop NTPase fold protein [Spongiibacter marinus]|uniref:KAP family P-loop NTPase fold protein n=1 Tax=Spongiibacter marinus TaxID=354246 RepID=UPI0035BE905B
MADGSLNDELIPWEKDKLNRKEEGDYLERILERLYKNGKTSYVINIDAEWGLGKSVFLEEIGKSLSKNHYVIQFNAWENDYSETPFESLICELVDQLPSRNEFVSVKRKIIDAASKIDSTSILKMGLTLATGNRDFSEDAANAVAGIIKPGDNDLLKRHREKKKVIENFKTSLKKLSEIVGELDSKEKYSPIFVMIDELDRCRPTFAVELLECVKHLFNIEGYYFLVATNTKELSHTIKSIYGADFGAKTYLNRFFDSYFTLSEPSLDLYLDHLDSKNNVLKKLHTPHYVTTIENKRPNTNNDPNYFLSEIFRQLGLTLRDTEQCYSKIEACLLSKTENSNEFHVVVIGFLVALNLRHNERYLQLKDQKDLTKIKDIMAPRNTKDSRIYSFKNYRDSSLTSFTGIQKYTLSEIIFQCFSFLEMELTSLSKQEYKDSFKSSLQTFFVRSVINTSGEKVKMGPSLNDYFDAVDRAGHIKATR